MKGIAYISSKGVTVFDWRSIDILVLDTTLPKIELHIQTKVNKKEVVYTNWPMDRYNEFVNLLLGALFDNETLFIDTTDPVAPSIVDAPAIIKVR